MHAARPVSVLLAELVTAQTAAADLCRRNPFEGENLAGIAASLHVRLAGTVAILATVLAFLDQVVVRRPLKTFGVDIFMAGLAGIAAHIAGGGRRLSGGFRCTLRGGSSLLCKTGGGQSQHKS